VLATIAVIRACIMTKDQFNRALADLGLSQSDTARLLGLGARTVRRHAAGQEISGAGGDPGQPAGSGAW
jgi:hypothetical protein